MASTIETLENGHPIGFTFDDLIRYHGPGSPGGVAHGFKVMERAFPLLEPDGPPERREVVVRTAFGGPGARDAIEHVTRAVTDGRFEVDSALARPQLGATRQRFIFVLEYRGRKVTLVLREGYVTEEFIELVGKQDRNADEEAHLDILKLEMAERVMASAAADVYDATVE